MGSRSIEQLHTNIFCFKADTANEMLKFRGMVILPVGTMMNYKAATQFDINIMLM